MVDASSSFGLGIGRVNDSVRGSIGVYQPDLYSQFIGLFMLLEALKGKDVCMRVTAIVTFSLATH